MSLPVADAHSHINDVRGLSARELASKFLSSGGWFIALVSVSPADYNMNISQDPLEVYLNALRHHVSLCKEVRSSGLTVSCLAGFHPDDVEFLASRGLGALGALKVAMKVLEAEADLCRKGGLDGIGEVGRQHYKSLPERLVASQLVLERAAEVAQDLGCVLHMHLEDVGPDTVELTHMALSSRGIRAGPRIVFHHAKPNMVAPATSLGYSATVPGRTEALIDALRLAGPNFMAESDFPGWEGPRILAPWNLGINIREAVAKAGLGEEALYEINIDNVVRAFGVEPP